MPPAAAGRYMFDEWQASPLAEGSGEPTTVAVPGSPSALAGADGVRYRTTFDDPREEQDDVAILELRGVYAHAEIEVTGTRLDGDWPVEHDAYFVPVRIPFIPAEAAGNELEVTCHAPRDRFGGIHDAGLVPDEDAVPGIWWDASLSARPLPCVEAMSIDPDLHGESATLHVETSVLTDEPLESAVTYSIKPEGDLQTRGMMERGSVEAPEPGRTTVEHELAVRDPALWWPRDLGPQNRYQVRAKFEDTELSQTAGICDVRYDDGSLLVNDERLPIRGVNLLTAAESDVDRAIEVNANLVRAHGHVLPTAVYERCDEAGLLVWQDLPLTGPGEFDVERGQALAGAMAGEYASHPSLAAFAVHDDPLETFADGLGSGLLSRLRLRWRAWRAEYDPTPAEEVAAALPEDRPVFPVVGGPGVEGDAASYYPGWEYGEAADIDRLLDRYPAGVVAEFGAASLGTDEVGEEGAGDGATGEQLLPAVGGFDPDLLERHVDSPEDSQAYQSQLCRTIVERLRRRGVGAIPFCLRDVGPAGMGVYAADGTPKRARESVGRSFAPTQVFLADPGGTNQITVVNDRPRASEATLEWTAGGETGSMELPLEAGGMVTGEPIPVPDDASAIQLTLQTDRFTVENSYEL